MGEVDLECEGRIFVKVRRGARKRARQTKPSAGDRTHPTAVVARGEESRLKGGCSQDWLPH